MAHEESAELTEPRVGAFDDPTSLVASEFPAVLIASELAVLAVWDDDVMHAASQYYLLNFDTDGPAIISVTAEYPHFWDGGVESSQRGSAFVPSATEQRSPFESMALKRQKNHIEQKLLILHEIWFSVTAPPSF